MKNLLKFSFLLALSILLFNACSKDDDGLSGGTDKPDNTGDSLVIELEGVLVLNEGSTTGSISYINTDKDSVANNVFQEKNSISLGAYPESMALSDSCLFITVTTGSGAGYVEVVDRSTLEHITYIDGLSYPREVTVGDDYVYVSNGKFEGSIFMISLSTLELSDDTIPVGYGPEKMIIDNGKLYVANSGGWSSDSTVSVIDLSTKSVVKTIKVKPGPKDMVLDADGNIWVYCSGEVSYDASWNATYENSGLSVISTFDYSVKEFDFDTPNSAVKSIAINSTKDIVYYMTNDGVYAIDIDATALPATTLINQSFYGIDVDPETDNIWVCDVQSYSTPSNVVVYSKDGTRLKGYMVGVIPNSSVFNR